MFQHALLNEIVAFVAVADTNSFTRGAERIHTTKSSVGKAVRKLEDDLGVKLFHRSTRSVRLTEEGAIYLRACQQALSALSNARQQFDARQAEPAGTVRINVPIGIGGTIVEALSNFTARYPKVSVEIHLSDSFVEAVEGELDVVVRIGELADSNLVARKLCQLKSILCASPEYLKHHSTPASISELEQHKALLYRAPNGRLRPWSFSMVSSNAAEQINPKATAVFSDGRALADAAISGLGIAQIYDKSVVQALRGGRLIELLPERAFSGPPMHALIPAGRVMPPKTRVFVEFLLELFE